MRLNKNFTAGIALTMDSFCTGGIIGNYIIKYKDITKVNLIVYDEWDDYVYGIRIDIHIADRKNSFKMSIDFKMYIDIGYLDTEYQNDYCYTGTDAE